MVSRRQPLPRATDEESARADFAAKPGLDQPGIQRPPALEGGSGGAAAADPRGGALLPGSRPDAGKAQPSRSSAAARLRLLPSPYALGQAEWEEHPIPLGALGSSSVAAVRRPHPARPLPGAPESSNSRKSGPARATAENRTESSDRLSSRTCLIPANSLSASSLENLGLGRASQGTHLSPAWGFGVPGRDGHRMFLSGSPPAAPSPPPPWDLVSPSLGSSSWPEHPSLVLLLSHLPQTGLPRVIFSSPGPSWISHSGNRTASVWGPDTLH